MKIHRFIDNFDLSGKELEIKGQIAQQIIKVLRLKAGEKIELGNGKGTLASGVIEKIENKSVVIVKIESLLQQTSEKKNKVILFCAILKKENFEMVVQKTTECGVYKIIPVITERTIKTGLNMERLQKIAKEASEQSGRINIPAILKPIIFDESLELANKDNLNIIFDKNGEQLSKIKNNSTDINIWIGPEGGWTEKELEKAKNHDFKTASLGSLILRGETAAIVSTYLASNL